MRSMREDAYHLVLPDAYMGPCRGRCCGSKVRIGVLVATSSIPVDAPLMVMPTYARWSLCVRVLVVSTLLPYVIVSTPAYLQFAGSLWFTSYPTAAAGHALKALTSI